MDNFLKNVEIKNFKSIKDLKFDAKKVNIFIGKPNVGKSNILEALSLFCAPYNIPNNKFLAEFIRYENFQNLFFDEDLSNNIEVKSNIYSVRIRNTNLHTNDFVMVEGNVIKDAENISFEEFFKSAKKETGFIKGNVSNDGLYNNVSSTFYSGIVKKFYYSTINAYLSNNLNFLNPPKGDNLFDILKKYKNLYKDIVPLFSDYGLNFVLKMTEKKFEIQKNIDGVIYTYPFLNTADTLQRYIFYLAAIHSNEKSVLLLEEPEMHSFPPYTKMLADKIIKDETNQYFITTHSPYFLYTIIENMALPDLNIYVTYYENFQTKVRLLDKQDLQDIIDDSIDVFFNIDRFTKKDE